MALTYEESAALMQNPTFFGRVKVAALNYSQYILEEAPDTPAHNTRTRWAQQCYLTPDNVTIQLVPPTVMDPAVQSDGANVTDEALQAAVQGVVDRML
jgi:hypothetical protein